MQELNFDEFFDIYKKEILPHTKEYEKERQVCLRKYVLINTVLYIALFVALFLFYLSFFIQKFKFSAILPFDVVFLIFILFGLVNWHFACNKNYKNSIKKRLLPILLKAYDNIILHSYIRADLSSIDPEQLEKQFDLLPGCKFNIPGVKLRQSALFPDFTLCKEDDVYTGAYKDVPFTISECQLIEEVKESVQFIKFKGVVISFKYNKSINNRTIVSEKGCITKKEDDKLTMIFMVALLIISLTAKIIILLIISLLYIILTFIQKEEPLNQINLEDTKFNNRFKVYSSDEIEARYLITPLFMELLSNLKTAFGNKKLRCSFFGDNLMIAISTNKDVFEVGDLFVPCDNPKCVLQFWREISSICKMVEYFKLNEKIFLKIH